MKMPHLVLKVKERAQKEVSCQKKSRRMVFNNRTLMKNKFNKMSIGEVLDTAKHSPCSSEWWVEDMNQTCQEYKWPFRHHTNTEANCMVDLRADHSKFSETELVNITKANQQH